ncbi:MAG: metal ABC transporter permease [Planctomycetes bacterium]|nr:metal ABC transporter permease [Planctomycetota bacterium]
MRGLIATLLVCFICGAMGSLVIGNRMAFFSDALAHSAFAGVGLGLLVCLLAGTDDDRIVRERITLIMVAFGIAIGLLIAFVREKTELASDTVIGVFFAGSIGLAAVVTQLGQSRRFFSIEDFIFGNPIFVQSWEVVLLLLLAVGTAIFLCVMYNWLVLASASSSLALSRQVPVRLGRYLFIVLLALMVNLSQQITGTLLINGLLIVPAAAAANVARNLRQMFWLSIGIAVAVGLIGNLLSWEINCRLVEAYGARFKIGISGTIIVLAVLAFVATMALGRWVIRRA